MGAESLVIERWHRRLQGHDWCVQRRRSLPRQIRTVASLVVVVVVLLQDVQRVGGVLVESHVLGRPIQVVGSQRRRDDDAQI